MTGKFMHDLMDATINGTQAMRRASYVRFKRKIKDVKSEKNDRGKDIKGKTRKEKVMKIINEMNLTNDQKDALYLLAGYAESTIRKAPWR